MKLTRITTRHHLPPVTLAGFAFATIARMNRRARAFRALAEVHAERARHVVYACRINSKLLEYHEALAGKYKTAAERHWMPVEPDTSLPRHQMKTTAPARLFPASAAACSTGLVITSCQAFDGHPGDC
jgi:hypothetical protein